MRISDWSSDVCSSDLWSATGCVNDRTQSGHSGARWSRSFVPNSEATIDIRNFEPQTGTYSVDRYFPGTDTVEAARKIRERYKVDQCTTDSGALADLAAMEADIRAILPARSTAQIGRASRGAKECQYE